MSNLKDLLAEQIDNLKTLRLQLESELQLISSRNAESLTKLLDEKSATLDAIAQQDSLVEVAYKKASEQDKDDEVNALFEQAKALLEDCKFRTQINEKAVQQGQLRLEHLRNLLLEARSKESMTYDKSGRTRAGTSSGAKPGKGISA